MGSLGTSLPGLSSCTAIYRGVALQGQSPALVTVDLAPARESVTKGLGGGVNGSQGMWIYGQSGAAGFRANRFAVPY
nr:hypothetical protein [uncultured bacterium]